MRNDLLEKMHSERGVSRLVVIAIVLVVILVLIALYPAYLLIKANADEVGCLTAMKKTQDMLNVEYLSDYELQYENAVAVVERGKWERDTVCPAGGDYYLIGSDTSTQTYQIVCGLHDSDTYERTRLNAQAVY